MVQFCKEAAADTIIVVTESGMLNRLRREAPGKRLVAGPTDSCNCSDCRFMKLNTPGKLRDCLKNLGPEIELDEETRKRAYIPIKRMLDWSR